MRPLRCCEWLHMRLRQPPKHKTGPLRMATMRSCHKALWGLTCRPRGRPGTGPLAAAWPQRSPLARRSRRCTAEHTAPGAARGARCPGGHRGAPPGSPRHRPAAAARRAHTPPPPRPRRHRRQRRWRARGTWRDRMTQSGPKSCKTSWSLRAQSLLPEYARLGFLKQAGALPHQRQCCRPASGRHAGSHRCKMLIPRGAGKRRILVQKPHGLGF